MTRAANAPGWPIVRGVQTLKEISVLTMRQEAAAAALDKLWADTFLTSAGIDSVNSTNYTYRGSANYDVIKTTSPVLSTPVMTSNNTPSGVASASVAGGGAAYLAFDQVRTGTLGWYDNGHSGLPQWVKYDFGAGNEKIITSYALTAGNTVPDRCPRDFKLQGSNDNSAWTDLDTQTAQTFTNNQTKSYSFSNSTAYRYYRLLASAVSSGDEVQMQELDLYLAAPASADIRSVRALNLPSAVTSLMPFFTVTLGAGTATYYVSTNDGSTWTEVPAAQVGTVFSVPSGTQIKLRVVLTGDAQLEDWGVAC